MTIVFGITVFGVVDKVVTSGEREITSDRIGDLVMRELRKLDTVAYVRFASVYRNFADLDEFSDVIREVKTPRAAKSAAGNGKSNGKKGK